MSREDFDGHKKHKKAQKVTELTFKFLCLFVFFVANSCFLWLRPCRAGSVPSNIAEGDERSSDKDSIRHFYMAKGSLAELRTQLEIALEIKCLPADRGKALLHKAETLARRLGALIKSRFKA